MRWLTAQAEIQSCSSLTEFEQDFESLLGTLVTTITVTADLYFDFQNLRGEPSEESNELL